MQTDSPMALRVGIFFTLALIIVMGLSLQVGRKGFFSDTYEVVAKFKQTNGIEPGTKVSLRGVPVGTIGSMDWDPSEFKVRTVLQINRRYQIPKNAIAKIQISSLLGGNHINIATESGPEDTDFLQQGDVIPTQETQSLDEVLARMYELGDESNNFIKNLDKDREATMGKIRSLLDDNEERINTTMEAFAAAGPELKAVAERINEMTEFVKAGEGAFGRLYKDPELYDDLRAVSDTMTEVADQVRSGEGTLGSLIYKEDTLTDLKAMMTDIQKAAKEIEVTVAENREEFKAMMTTLSNSRERIEEAIKNFTEVSAKINEGKGTIGLLVNDPKLYEDTKRAMNQVGESFESGEEQGVFRSFLGLLFGALI